MKKRKVYNVLLSILVLFSLCTYGFIFVNPLIKIVNAIDITEYLDTNTTLSVLVAGIEPRINWYDFQNAASVSKQNEQIDVDQEYKFCINISSDQGWDDINYIDIAAWYDNGNEGSTYNQTLGGNINLYLQYSNLTGTSSFNMLWPDNEATIGSMTEIIATDPNGSPGYTECRNLTFSFTPGYQFRYARGDGSWNNTNNATDDSGSWNFRISVTDSGENASGPTTSWVLGEFGVYSYTEITSAGSPSIEGNPGQNATADSNITLVTRSNGNYSLSVDVDDLIHKDNPIYNISNQTVWIRGGDLDVSNNLDGSAPLYLYGDSTTFVNAENDGINKTTNDIEYKCSIPIAQQTGDYTATITYTIKTQT